MPPSEVFVLLLVLIVAAMAVGLMFMAVKRRQPAGPWPLYARKPMSVPEQVLYFRLRDALPDHIVLAQVQLSRFQGVRTGNPLRSWLNRIDRKSVDLLVLQKDASVVAAIELDDSTHDRPQRRAADANKAKALQSAGVRLLRWQDAAMPTGDRIQQQIVGNEAAQGQARPAAAVPPQSR